MLAHSFDTLNKEEEANFFASYLLIPSCLCFKENIYCFINDPNTIMNMFGASFETSKIAIDRMIKRYNFSNKPNNYELIILDSLESLNKKPV